MSRRKCCCKKGGDVDPPPKPDDSKCTEPQLYTTESINYDFSDNCKPRLNDGFGQIRNNTPVGPDTNYCWQSDKFETFRDQNGNKIYDNYAGRHYSAIDTWDVLRPKTDTPSFYGISGSTGGGFAGSGKSLGNGIQSHHRFHINGNDIKTIGYKLQGSCDLGFMRFGRTDIDQTGWGNRAEFNLGIPTYSYGPYPKRIGLEANFSVGSVNVSSKDVLINGNGSLGLPFQQAFYETTLTLPGASKTFNTPLSYYYNSVPTISWEMEIINIEYIPVNDGSGLATSATIRIIVEAGGGTLEHTYVKRIGPCFSGRQYTYNLLSKGIKIRNSTNTTAKNYYTTYPDALNLTGVYPDIAFCFSAMDNFIWEPTIV